MSQAIPAGLTEWLPTFVADERRPEMVRRWVDRTRDAILDQVPALAADPDLAGVLDQAVHEHWVGFLDAFSRQDQQFRLVDGAATLAREVATHNLPLEAIITVYRAAQQESWDYVTGVVESLPVTDLDATEVLIYFWGRAGAWIDGSIGASIEVYQAERGRRLAGASAQRFETVADILEGHATDARSASAALGGYPISVIHAAYVLETDRPELVADLEKLIHEVARLTSGSTPLVVSPGGRVIWAWIAHPSAPDLSDLDQFEAQLTRSSARMFVGIPAGGLDGFISSHQEAVGTRRIATSGSPWSLVMRYEEVALVAMLGCSEQVDRFVDRTLGELADDGEPTQRIRETVAAFLRHGGKVEAAASELVVHRNTVRYRVGRAEEILGRPVARGGDELLIAIRHRDMFHSS